MKIGIIHSKLNGKGGSQRQALSLAYELQREGNEVTVYTLLCDKERCFTQILEKLHIVALNNHAKKLRPIPWLGVFNYFRHSAEENRRARALAMLIDADTDVLNAHDRLGFHVATYAKKYVRPFPSVLMMNDILTKRWIAWRRGQFSKEYVPGLAQRLWNRIIDFYEVRRFIAPHEKMVVLDNRTAGWSRTYFGKDAIVVRSGVDGEEFPFVPHHMSRDREVRLFMAGIFFVHRRYEDMIRSVSILRKKGYDIALVIAGAYEGNQEYFDYHRNLIALSKEFELENYIEYRGKISDDELKMRYQKSDIYISSNHLQSWGLAVFEAMASGCPVVVSTTAGAAEVLTDGENALIVEAKNPEAYASAIERLITNRALYGALSMNGRKFVEHSISWERYAEGMMKVFASAINRT